MNEIQTPAPAARLWRHRTRWEEHKAVGRAIIPLKTETQCTALLSLRNFASRGEDFTSSLRYPRCIWSSEPMDKQLRSIIQYKPIIILLDGNSMLPAYVFYCKTFYKSRCNWAIRRWKVSKHPVFMSGSTQVIYVCAYETSHLGKRESLSFHEDYGPYHTHCCRCFSLLLK